jgi:tetratricopeptide (TPR) repeat protein
VAKRLVAWGTLLDSDPDSALAHAMVARRLAPRVASVREAVGLASYHAGQWHAAIAELRTYHRITGRQTHLAVIADCERALGRPERAVDLYRAADLDKLEPDEAIELLIVAAGARGDLGQVDAAAAMLQVPDLRDDDAPWAARLRYAYADALRAAGRIDEARNWFARAADVDVDLVTDAAERLLDLDGVVIDDPALEDVDTPEAVETSAVDAIDAGDTEAAGTDVADTGTDTDTDTDTAGTATAAGAEASEIVDGADNATRTTAGHVRAAGHAVIFAAPDLPDPEDGPEEPAR